MTTSTANTSLPVGAVTLHKIGRAIDSVSIAFGEWWRVRRTVAELRRLTPAQLADIGLTEADVDALARTGRI